MMQHDIRGRRVHVTHMLCCPFEGRLHFVLSRRGRRAGTSTALGSIPIGASSRSTRGCSSTAWSWWSPMAAVRYSVPRPSTPWFPGGSDRTNPES